MSLKDSLYYKGYFGEEEPEKEDEPDKELRAQPDTQMLYKKLEKLFFDSRSIHMWGIVDDRSAKDVVSKLLLLEADAPGKEIKFFISSPGGSVTSGMVIYDTMRMIKSPVSTICMGLAASMGSILLSGGIKGKRLIYPHGEVMIHQPSLGGYFQATSADIEIHAKQMQRTKEISAQILANNTGKSYERIMKDFDRDYWMDAKEAVVYGIVDNLIDKL